MEPYIVQQPGEQLQYNFHPSQLISYDQLQALSKQHNNCPDAVPTLPQTHDPQTGLALDAYLFANWREEDNHYMSAVVLLVRQILTREQKFGNGREGVITNVIVCGSNVSELQISAW